jgi:hypothetical protein
MACIKLSLILRRTVVVELPLQKLPILSLRIASESEKVTICFATNQRRLGDYTGMHCEQTHFITYYWFLGSARHCSSSFSGSQNWRSISIIAPKMESFRCICGKNVSVTSVLNGHELLFVQCVSKETLILIPSRLLCVELECRENSAVSIGCL